MRKGRGVVVDHAGRLDGVLLGDMRWGVGGGKVWHDDFHRV